MARVAFMTIGLLHAAEGDPRVQPFFDRVEANFALAAASDGFIARSVRDEVTGAHSWGEWTTPSIFRQEAYEGRRPQTLSLWRDLESVFAFAYHGLHAEALSQRRAWFVHGRWPAYVAWWVADDHIPSWEEACTRYDRLHRQGPTPAAFDFKHPFGPDSEPIVVDRAVVKQKAAQYQS